MDTKHDKTIAQHWIRSAESRLNKTLTKAERVSELIDRQPEWTIDRIQTALKAAGYKV